MERAFVYGDLLFETIAFREGKICYLNKHVNRLNRGLQLLQMKGTVLSDDLSNTIHSQLKDKKDARIRVIAYRNAKGNYLPESHQFGLEVEVFDLPEIRENIDRIGIYQTNAKSCNPISSFKTGNALVSVLAAIEGQELAMDDMIIFNQHNRVCEAISSNVFIVKNEVLKTPAFTEGCVMGVMREVLIEECVQQSIKVEEGMLTMEDLLEADELFLTNTIQGIRDVKQFGSKTFGSEMAQRLRILVQG